MNRGLRRFIKGDGAEEVNALFTDFVGRAGNLSYAVLLGLDSILLKNVLGVYHQLVPLTGVHKVLCTRDFSAKVTKFFAGLDKVQGVVVSHDNLLVFLENENFVRLYTQRVARHSPQLPMGKLSSPRN